MLKDGPAQSKVCMNLFFLPTELTALYVSRTRATPTAFNVTGATTTLVNKILTKNAVSDYPENKTDS